MPKPKKKPQSREEILERKRKKERERYARIKNDPIRLAAYKEKDKQKYLKGKATGVIKTINEMTDREKRKCRKSWRARSSKYYKKKCAAKKASEDFMRANTPSSISEEDRCPNITLFTVTNAEIEEMEKLISSNQPNLLPFKGTLQIHQVQGNAYSPLKLVMKTLSCFCSNVCEHFQMGIVKYSTMKANVDDIFSESETERSNAGSTSILKSSDMVDLTSVLGMNNGDLDGLLEMPVIDIDTNELFPVEEKRRGKKRKMNENDILIERNTNCREKTKRSGNGKRSSLNEKKRAKLKSNKPVKRKEKKWKESESNDCACLICGVLYKEDTTGQDWIQCIMCHQWAQINCIKTDITSYTCSECLPDGDFVP